MNDFDTGDEPRKKKVVAIRSSRQNREAPDPIEAAYRRGRKDAIEESNIIVGTLLDSINVSWQLLRKYLPPAAVMIGIGSMYFLTGDRRLGILGYCLLAISAAAVALGTTKLALVLRRHVDKRG